MLSQQSVWYIVMRTSVGVPESIWKAHRGGIHLQSQNWGRAETGGFVGFTVYQAEATQQVQCQVTNQLRNDPKDWSLAFACIYIHMHLHTHRKETGIKNSWIWKRRKLKHKGFFAASALFLYGTPGLWHFADRFRSFWKEVTCSSDWPALPELRKSITLWTMQDPWTHSTIY